MTEHMRSPQFAIVGAMLAFNVMNKRADMARPIQGLIRHFRPELERRIAEYRAMNKAAE